MTVDDSVTHLDRALRRLVELEGSSESWRVEQQLAIARLWLDVVQGMRLVENWRKSETTKKAARERAKRKADPGGVPPMPVSRDDL
ncbi:MAG: hypothetical protein PVJ64_00460 [Gemmatimonadales bacterium]